MGGMDHGLAHDPHPDDAEAERLHALYVDTMREHAAAWAEPDGETEAERKRDWGASARYSSGSGN